jgi:hypothetical protein
MLRFLALLPLAIFCCHAADTCGFSPAFTRPDERGTQRVQVFQGPAEPGSGGAAPLAFVSTLKVNTDGTRVSYKVDDPRAVNGAINPIGNALRRGQTVADFERIARNNWEPVEETWRVLSANVIEKDKKTGKPCVAADGYLVSKTADYSVAGGAARDGDCDQGKWIDALTIPALVLPSRSEFQARKALTRSLVVAMTMGEPRRLAFGIVGDTGPEDEIGEASVEMNRMLNGLPAGAVPRNGKDAVQRFQGPKSIVLVFPGPANRLPYPVTPERVMDRAKARFEAWGGMERLAACAAQLPASR